LEISFLKLTPFISSINIFAVKIKTSHQTQTMDTPKQQDSKIQAETTSEQKIKEQILNTNVEP
jgi:hypothetical protein